MITHLLDTSVCSQPLRRRPLAMALQRWDRLASGAATSVVCLAEIEWGLHKLSSERLWMEYREVVLPSLEILETDRQTWAHFARLKARQEAMGRPIMDMDLLISATAIRHGLTLATLNTRDFSAVEGLRWEDWSK